MTALIDMDAVLYRGLFGAKLRSYYEQLRNCENIIERIQDRLKVSESILFLSGNKNFRKEIYPLYKSNRKDSERPFYLQDAKMYFLKYWNAICNDIYEADDLIAMNHDENTIMVSNDKDFYTVGGNLYNPFTNTLYYIDNPEFHFYKQLCTGDQIDSIPGIRNPAKSHHRNPPNFTDGTATELLKDLSKEEMKLLVQSLYYDQFGNDWFHEYERNAKLLFLKRSETANYYDYF